jgi:hypothetical protein
MLYISKYVLAKLYALAVTWQWWVLRSIVSGFYMRTRACTLEKWIALLSLTHPIYIQYRTNILYTTPFQITSTLMFLVCTLEWRYSLALVLIQCSTDDLPVAQIHLAVGLLLPRQSVLHPLLVIAVRVVLAGVCTS